MNSIDQITVELVPDTTDDVRALMVSSIGCCRRNTRRSSGTVWRWMPIFAPGIRFFLARSNGRAVGCGGVAFFAGFAEVKRMCVREVVRGRGVAQALLARIEAEARAAGFGLLMLETGLRQIAALRFYQRSGFHRCAAFGAYVAMAPQAIGTSVFLQKRLVGVIP